jgi:plastocyanin
VATTYPARDDIVTDAPTFEWTTNATDAQAVVQVSWDGTFGPAARLDFGPTTSRSITADDERWQQLLEEWDGVRPLLWRVMLNEADGATGTSAAQRFFAAVPTQVIHIPNGVNVFAPSHIVIDQGQSVTWWNDSVAAGNLQSESHDVQLFNEHGNAITAMEELNSSSSFTWTFDEVGRWNALCHRHSGAGLADAPTMEGEHAHRGAGPYHCMSSSVTIR